MVFRAKFFEEQKNMEGDQFDRKDAEELAKVKWSKMGQETKGKFVSKKSKTDAKEEKSKSAGKD
jgi:hypothetical protein